MVVGTVDDNRFKRVGISEGGAVVLGMPLGPSEVPGLPYFTAGWDSASAAFGGVVGDSGAKVTFFFVFFG